jgi:oligoendopeptidase F
MARLDGMRSTIRSPATLTAALATADSIATESTRLSYYFHLRAAVDVRDLAAAHAEDSVDAEVASRTQWLTGAVGRIPPDSIDRWTKARPSFARYAFMFDEARRRRAHTLADTEEALFQKMAPLAMRWQFPLWQRLAPAGREPRAYVVIETVRAHDALARLHGYSSAPEEIYASRHLTIPAVRALMGRVRSRTDLYRRFLQLRQENASRGDAPLTIPLDSVVSVLTGALRPLGPDYVNELRALFDPAQRRIDLGPGSNRQRGGFSAISPGRASVVYLDQYAGSLRDFSRLTHESAHALHRQLMDIDRVPPSYRSGPLLMEPIALFNELAALDYVYKQAAAPGARRQALQQFLNKAFEVFLGAQDAEMEQSIYDGVESGAVASADQLDSVVRAVDSAYTLPPANEGRRWMTAQLLVEDPLYLSNYLYSGMIALAFYSEYAAAPAAFGPPYVRFLSSGFDARPYDVVRRSLGIDLSRADLLDRGLALLGQRLEEFKALIVDK